MFFDTHAHLDDEHFAEDQELVIQRALDQQVSRIVNIGCSRKAAISTLEVIDRYDFIYGAVGLHPHDAKDMDEQFINDLRQWVQHPKVVAIGEIGLDYYYDLSPRDIQKEAFRQQIRLAIELDLPITIHDRDAHQDVFDILTEEKGWSTKGIYHCYSGSEAMAKEITKKGFYISFAGAVTFKNANKLRAVAQSVPLDRILIETDSPYLTPVPLRGKRNEPAYVIETAKVIAELRGLTLEEVAKLTWDNGHRAYRIPEERGNHEA